MVREFSEEKKEEIFRILDEIDMKEWKPFMEWCGSSAEEFGDWPERLNVSAYTRYVDEYHKKVLELNEMTRQQVNTVFENVAEINTRYAGRMKECQAKIKEQIAMVNKMTEFMQSMTDGIPNMALITKGSVNENCVRMENERKEKKEGKPYNYDKEEERQPEVVVVNIPEAEGQVEEVIDAPEFTFANQITDFIDGRSDDLDYDASMAELDCLRDRGLISEENYNCLKEIIDTISKSNDKDYDIEDLREQAREAYAEVEKKLLEFYINEDMLKALGWDIEAAKNNLHDDNFTENMRELMLEYGLTDERSIIMFLISITHECDGGRSMLEYGNKEYFDGQSYSESEKGTGLLQLTLEENQIAFMRYITGREEEDSFDDLLGNMTMPEYIAQNYPIESALWFWCVYNEKISFYGKPYSINDAIETYGDTADFFNMFIATQCAVNSSEFIPRGIGRLFRSYNSIELSDVKYIQETTNEYGDKIEIPHDDGSIILHYSKDYDGDISGNAQSYKPDSLDDRIKIYNSFLVHLEKQGVIIN